jgi:putative transmembrane protein
MTHTQTITPKKRINSIDALRGVALIGIMLLHCMERFDLTLAPVVESPFWQAIDTAVYDSLYFLFSGKSYAMFSLLFGLSFFMQMESQAAKGVDFRGRFLWRLALLFLFGYINGLVYMGEFFMVYAVLGVFLIPLYKVPTRWLLVLCVLLFLQIPAVISFVSLLSDNVANEPTAAAAYMDRLFERAADVFINGSLMDVLSFNTFDGQSAKCLWVFNNFRYLQLLGLFIAGMLIGRQGIHKSEEKMVKYSRLFLPYCLAFWAVFYAVAFLLPVWGVDGFALRVGQTLFKTYGNLGQMMVYFCGFTLLYYRYKGQKVLDRIAPVGRMSVTNYMAQSIVGVSLFYGFGGNFAVEFNYLQSFLLGAAFCVIQIAYSNWWIKRFYYGPMEWLWRSLTWFQVVPLSRRKASLG